MKIPSGPEIDKAVLTAIEKVSADLTKRVRKDSIAILKGRRTFFRGFEQRLRKKYYGAALDLSELLLFLCLDEGASFNGERRPAAARDNDLVFDALTRLHARGCLIASEIITLLRTGHPDGANARWRSLHETAVTAMFIAKHGQGTAERFLLHDGIKSHEDAQAYQEHCGLLGYEVLTEDQIKAVTERYTALLKTFGEDYKGGYGWASSALRGATPAHKGGISFFHLEENVGVPHMQPYYRMASHTVHAGAKSIRFSLGVIEPSSVLPAGPSNAGLADPGQCCALSLASLTATLLSHRLAGDNTVEESLECSAVLLTIQTFVKECCDSWAEADAKLKADDKRHRAKSDLGEKRS